MNLKSNKSFKHNHPRIPSVCRFKILMQMRQIKVVAFISIFIYINEMRDKKMYTSRVYTKKIVRSVQAYIKIINIKYQTIR